MLLLAIFHAGPMGLAPYVPLRWQHGSTPGVTVHGAWVSSGLGTQRVSDGRSFILFECEPPAIAAFWANATDDRRRAAVEHTKRYIDAPTPADALRIWLETEPLPMAGIGGAGGAELARSAELIPRLGLEV